ncbi:unnamed protein product [Gulo gulo]|uniref:Uncharacterized protein n=1 Tax=Gulo gulo TaxID=48420 RepID=A0A9X9LGD5_GULGU|nr:unnamed protein product [Gulo gulo]
MRITPRRTRPWWSRWLPEAGRISTSGVQKTEGKPRNAWCSVS